MSRRPACRRNRPWRRLLTFLRGRRRDDVPCGDWFGDEPPEAFVREPLRPRPFGPSASAALELPSE